MYGLEAIAAQNGWAQAATGAIIVMSGLAILSTIISFLPKIVALFEDKKVLPKVEPKDSIADSIISENNNILDVDVLKDITEAAKIYTIFIEPLGDSFQLGDLYQSFIKNNLPHPHLTIKSFREAGFLQPKGEGEFSWKL